MHSFSRGKNCLTILIFLEGIGEVSLRYVYAVLKSTKKGYKICGSRGSLKEFSSGEEL